MRSLPLPQSARLRLWRRRARRPPRLPPPAARRLEGFACPDAGRARVSRQHRLMRLCNASGEFRPEYGDNCRVTVSVWPRRTDIGALPAGALVTRLDNAHALGRANDGSPHGLRSPVAPPHHGRDQLPTPAALKQGPSRGRLKDTTLDYGAPERVRMPKRPVVTPTWSRLSAEKRSDRVRREAIAQLGQGFRARTPKNIPIGVNLAALPHKSTQ